MKNYPLPLTYSREYVNSKPVNITDPIVMNNITIPKSRFIHLNMTNMIEDTEEFKSLDVVREIDKERTYLMNISKLYNPTGKVRTIKKNLGTLNREMMKSIDKCKLVEEDGKYSITNRDLLVMNYKNIYVNNIYQVSPLRNKFIVDNALSTLVNTINKINEAAYNLIVLDMPSVMPSITTFNTYSKRKIDATTLKALPDVNSLIILELWNMMFEDRDSIFKSINTELLDKIYLVFRSNGKYTTYRLLDLIALSNENELSGGFKKKSATMAAKILITTLTLFKVKTTVVDSKGLVDIDIDDMTEEELDSINVDMGIDDDTNTSTKEEESVEDDVELDTNSIAYTDYGKSIEDRTNAKATITNNLNKLVLEKGISKAEYSRLIDTLEEQDDKVFEINGKKTKLKDILDYDNVAMDITSVPLSKDKIVMDAEMLGTNNKEVDTRYMKELYQKDIFNAIYSVQNSGVVVNSHEIVKKKSYLGEVEEHILELRPIKGKGSSKVKIIIPTVDPDTGTYHMSGNEYLLRDQRKDLPIRKTSPSKVLLTSYSGKMFVEKKLVQASNPSIWIKKRLTASDAITNMIVKQTNIYDVTLPNDYTTIGSEVSRFNYNKYLYIFDYKNRLSIMSDLKEVDEVKKIEAKGLILIAVNKSNRIYMDNDGLIGVIDSGKFKTINNNIYEHLNIDVSKMPLEFASIGILSRKVPLGVILLYYMGFKELISKLECEYKFYSKAEKYKPTIDEYAIELSDGKYIFKRSDRLGAMILAGIPKDVSKLLESKDLNNKEKLNMMFNLMELSISHATQIDTIETAFIDNITRDNLRLMKEPTHMHELLIRAGEMLTDDNYKNPNNIADNSIVRYERIAGLINKTLSDSIRTFNMKNVASKARLSVDPYEVWKMIGDDSTSVLVSNNNPIDTIKQRDSVTYLGEFGRSKITMTLPSRVMTPEEVGIISEATPDDGSSGISTYLTHSSEIKNLRGMVGTVDASKSGLNKCLSSANILNPFITHDDSKRSNFAVVQASHIIPMIKMSPTRVWTGAESIMGVKAGKPFTYVAEGNGVVTKLTKNSITIKYSKPKDDNIIDLYVDDSKTEGLREVYDYLVSIGYNVVVTKGSSSTPNHKYIVSLKKDLIKASNVIHIDYAKNKLSKLSGIKKAAMDEYNKSYSLRSWASKVEANQSIKHNMTTILKEGSKVSVNDIVVYDDAFFQPNIFDPKSVIIKMGSTQRVAFIEKKTTYEDSIEMNRKLLEDSGELKYKILSKVVDVTSHITNAVKEGDSVKYGDKLMTIIDASIINDTSLSEYDKAILSEISDASPKANANGVIDRIDVIYNCELDEMDSSIRELADISNKRFKDERGTDGKVTSEYSISGIPLAANQIELKYYIGYKSKTKIGDKFRVGHQLKATVGVVRDDIITEDGEEVDIIFSFKSLLNRITNSGYMIGVAGAIMEDITKRAVEAYYK